MPTEVVSRQDAVPRGYVDWAAVFGAASIATASALLLAGVGAALGLAMVSPWSDNPSATTVGLAAAAWSAIVTLYAGGVGGYLAGRLRKPADDATRDEVSFRDGANGLVVWAVGSLAATMLLACLAMMASRTVVTAASTVGSSGVADYYIGRALQSDAPTANAAQGAGAAETRTELGRIVARSVSGQTLQQEDRAYMGRIIARNTGLPEAEAQARVDKLLADAKAAADTARKATAFAASWTAIVTLLAAVLAWYMATIGGAHRDQSRIVSTRPAP